MTHHRLEEKGVDLNNPYRCDTCGHHRFHKDSHTPHTCEHPNVMNDGCLHNITIDEYIRICALGCVGHTEMNVVLNL